MKLLKLVPLIAALALGGCALLQQALGNSPAASDAMKGAQVAITTYADVYQPAVIAYGSLPACPQATLCKDASTLAKLKAADLAVTNSITAAQKVMEGSVTDAGQITAAIQAIQSAEAAIAASGALSPK